MTSPKFRSVINNPNGINVGDSIWLKYATEDPGLIITELKKVY